MAKERSDLRIDPTRPKDMQRLREAVRESQQELTETREKRNEMVDHFVGSHYSSKVASQDVPTNYLELMINTLIRQLAARAPQVLITTFDKDLKSFAKTFEGRINDFIRVDIPLQPIIRRWLLDAMFPGFGILKIALKQTGTVEEAPGRFRPVGSPFVARVDLDDWVHDMTARDWDEVQFMGDRRRVSYDWVRNNPEFDAKARRMLSPGVDPLYNEGGVRRLESLSRTERIDIDTYRKKIDIWDYWLPAEGLIITAADKEETPALDVREWTGPTRGMYRHLWFNEVPNQIMPLSPASIVLDLHMILNDLYNKLASQADRQKQVGVVSPSGADDADRIVQAADGEVIKSQHPQATREINFGGPDQTTFAFMLQTKQLFNLFAGNPELLGGSGPQADTLGQDQMNLASANHRVQDMQDTLVVATQQLIQDLAFYIWNEPLEEAQVYKPLKNTRFGARTTFSPENLKGEFLKYRIQIEPYSMQHITPSEKLDRLFMLMERMVFPGLPIFQSQGQVPDMREYLKIAAKYANLESEINDIFRYTGAQPQQGQSQGPPVSPPSPSERRAPANRSTQTQQGQDAALVQRLIGGPLQQSEAQREFVA